MQKINIKKLTKEKLAEMYAEAKSAYDAAMDDEERRVRELEEQNKELIALTEKLKANDKALSEATEKREAAEKESGALCSELARANEARKKAESEGRELAKQLGERMVELKAAEENARKAAVETNSIRAQLSEAETNAKRKEELLCAALHTIKTEKSIKEDYHKSLKWCMAHPWRNLWRCMKEHFRF